MSNSKRKCGGCSQYFRPQQEFPGPVAWCGTECALIVAKKRVPAVKAKIQKQEMAKHRELKDKVKSRQDWLREAQVAFNGYIRERDAGKPCISCDKPDNGQHQRHASHYRSVKACSVLRFNTRNVHTSCATCNAILSGNLLEYRIRLVQAKGQEYVEWLECQNEPRSYSIEYLRRLKSIANKKTKMLRKRRDMACTDF